jgi:hypothetical protein
MAWWKGNEPIAQVVRVIVVLSIIILVAGLVSSVKG